MLKDAAINWALANCPDPKVALDIGAALDASAAAGANCWFAIGSGMTRAREPYLLNCFCGEVFIFQLTPDQSAALQVRPYGMLHRPEYKPQPSPAVVGPAISLERFVIDDAAVDPSRPIIGRLDYEVLANGGSPWCVRLDYDLPKGRMVAWDYPQQVLRGKGAFSVRFSPINFEPSVTTAYRGPLTLFVRLFELSPPTDQRWPISTTCAALVDVV